MRDTLDYWTYISRFPSAAFHQNHLFYVFVNYDAFCDEKLILNYFWCMFCGLSR
jgi:hypothetical protein